MKRFWRRWLWVPLVLIGVCWICRRAVQAADDARLSKITFEGLERTYFLHEPPNRDPNKKLPLVMVFHGGSGNAIQMERFTKFSELADRENFIVLYANGIEKNWNDGRTVEKSHAHSNKINDVGFIEMLIDKLIKENNVDPARVYSTGISNGAIFSHTLALKLSGKIAAIAGVCGSLAKDLEGEFKPGHPVSILVMNGTTDPLVPYSGGEIGLHRGDVIGTDEIVKKWVELDGCKTPPAEEPVIDADPNDKTSIQTFTYSGGKENTEVVLMKINGGGHTWPRGTQYLPVALIGRVSQEIDGTKVIWEFFKKHSK